MKLIINGSKESVQEVRDCEGYQYHYLEIVTDYGEYVMFKNSNEAGSEARARWEDMAKNDPAEFTCIVGEKALVAWCLGQPYAVGSQSTSSLEEWLDLHLTHPEEEFARYDGQEIDMSTKPLIQEEGDEEEWAELLDRYCKGATVLTDMSFSVGVVMYRTN